MVLPVKNLLYQLIVPAQIQLKALPGTDLGQLCLGWLDKTASLAFVAKRENRNQ
jgi:hypothetical protein